MPESTGQVSLRAENVSAVVTGFALQSMKLMQLCMVNSSSSWVESYFKESKADLVGGTSESIKGIPRLAAFPYGQPDYVKVQSYIEKYGMEGVVSAEDELTNSIDVIARTLLRIGRAVSRAVDTQIEEVLATATGTNTITIAAGNEWDSATVANRDPIFDILAAEREISIDNYDILDGNGYLIVNPTDYARLISNTKVLNNPTFKAADVVQNGVVGQIAGLKIIVTNACRVSQAYCVKAKEALTWKEVKPLTVVTIDDPGVKKTIRAYLLGVAQVPNPEAICVIKNTDG